MVTLCEREMGYRARWNCSGNRFGGYTGTESPSDRHRYTGGPSSGDVWHVSQVHMSREYFIL